MRGGIVISSHISYHRNSSLAESRPMLQSHSMRLDARPDQDPALARRRAASWLSGAGLRPTRQRLALAGLLVGDGHNRHVTAESLHEAAAAIGASVSLATVYNTLRAFCDAGLMNEITVDGSRSYFDTRTDEHPHYYWEGSGRLTDAPVDAVTLIGEPRIPEGAQLSRIDVVIRLRAED